MHSQPEPPPRRQPPFWRLTERLELLIHGDGWPARLSRRLGYDPAVRVVEHRIEWTNAPPEVPALRVGFASDFHAGPTTDAGLLRRACESLGQARPDLLLLGGDFVSLDAHQIDWLAPLLGRIPAPLGRFAVLGNHDRWSGADHIARALESAGIAMLTNRNRRLPPPYQHVWVCGLDDFVSGTPDVRSALEGADGGRIVLMHGPANLVDLEGQRFDLALCGHTHGGQIALPSGRPIAAAPGPLARRYSRGRFAIKEGGTLVVSVGLGCSGLPLRVNAQPEILLCDLQPRDRRPTP